MTEPLGAAFMAISAVCALGCFTLLTVGGGAMLWEYIRSFWRKPPWGDDV